MIPQEAGDKGLEIFGVFGSGHNVMNVYHGRRLGFSDSNTAASTRISGMTLYNSIDQRRKKMTRYHDTREAGGMR